LSTSKFKLNWLTGNKKNIAACYLEDLLGIRSSENSPNDKQQAVNPEDHFLIFFKHVIKKYILKKKNCKNFKNQTTIILNVKQLFKA